MKIFLLSKLKWIISSAVRLFPKQILWNITTFVKQVKRATFLSSVTDCHRGRLGVEVTAWRANYVTGRWRPWVASRSGCISMARGPTKYLSGTPGFVERDHNLDVPDDVWGGIRATLFHGPSNGLSFSQQAIGPGANPPGCRWPRWPSTSPVFCGDACSAGGRGLPTRGAADDLAWRWGGGDLLS
jgi:hypothetical protein